MDYASGARNRVDARDKAQVSLGWGHGSAKRRRQASMDKDVAETTPSPSRHESRIGHC